MADRYAKLPIGSVPANHWLMLAIEVIDRSWPDERLKACISRMAAAIINSARVCSGRQYAHWDFRLCPTATRAEGLGAAFRVAARGGLRFDALRIFSYLSGAVAFCLKCQITDGKARRWTEGKRGIGGFVDSPMNPVVRIDYVQHAIGAINGLIYANQLLSGELPADSC